MTVLDSIGGVIDLAKKVKSAVDSLRDSETKLAIADLISQLADLKVELAMFVSENEALKKQIATLKEQKLLDLALKGDCYFAGDDGPFCTTCWDTKSKRVRLKEELLDFQAITGHKYVCPVCDTRHKGQLQKT